MGGWVSASLSALNGRTRVARRRLGPKLEQLRAWAARRPEAIARRQPAWTWATQGAIAGTIGVCAVMALLAGLALGPLSGSSTGQAVSEPTASPVAAAPATPLATWSPAEPPESAAPDSSPSSSPTGGPTLGPAPTWATIQGNWPAGQPVAPTTLATVACNNRISYGDMEYAATGNRLYVICDRDVKAIDLPTNQVVATYASVFRRDNCDTDTGQGACVADERAIAVTKWLWASEHQPSIPPDISPVTRRINVSTKKVAETYDGWLSGSGNDTVLITDENDGVATDFVAGSSGASRGDGDTGDASYWPGCGSFWRVAQASEGSTQNQISQLDITGASSWSTIEDGDVVALGEVGGQCWAVINHRYSTKPDEWRFVRLGTSGVEQRWSTPWKDVQIQLEGGAMWIVADGTVQQLDPRTGQLLGQRWRIGSDSQLIVASGTVWLATLDDLERLDIPIQALPSLAPTSPTPSASASPTPSASASPTPSATPGATATASGTPTAGPVESPTGQPSS
jgi:hypothetical protein